VDLAWRLGNRGHEHLFVPTAVAWHCRKGPDVKPGPLAARAFANRYVVFLKNESWWLMAAYGPLALGWEGARLLRRAMARPRLVAGVVRELPRVVKAVTTRFRAGLALSSHLKM
jgi:hypothetical protein